MSETSFEKTLHQYFPFGFHLSRKSWEWLDIRTLIGGSESGETISDIYPLRRLADRHNKRHLHSSHVVEHVHAGQLLSVGVIVDVLRYMSAVYCHKEHPGVIAKGVHRTSRRRSRATVEQPPPSFVGLFPPLPVMQKEQTENEFMQATSEVAPNREVVVSEMILLSVAMANPAFETFRSLFDDTDLKKQSPYVPFIGGLETFFSRQPESELVGMRLFDILRAPMQASPDSLEGQLDYIRDHWAEILPRELLERLLLARDVLKEERRLRGLGPGPVRALEFGKGAYGIDLGYPEPACFSRDADWMSNVVIIAKTTYVWLDQLSKKYKRHIKHLSDIPDEELDLLARWGFTGLWLIGVWERSEASQTIKRIMGNPEAAPSAYSLYDYVIAEDLGGDEAYGNLRERAWQRGIRLASDMVPNHVGVFSKWVIEHPDWFLQLDYPPYPGYRFTGTDLSSDPRVTVQIEDGYWEHRDAAVVFKRTDKWTGDERYLYHGNDGTSMPWNDTAQLNFMLPEVREAVVQTILHVARRFPIIRFDAAMTLAKKHYQRLWFPPQGEGGAIPSRAEHGMSRAKFDAVFDKEFWREVVDRVALEVPDTLLLAEAFWLMEGYFVRTLGMHRVYNSAFMNMLKMEDNAKYRMTVKNVLRFSPEVLKRFVNFMNNPDEATAVAQFGKGDKYYGVAVLMVTMPGLPMFGHGQIEGFTEKYGMEYRRAYWDEQVDDEMVRRHENEIFPLMRRRSLFSGVENFAIYDFNTSEGWVDENVFAYSNRSSGERALLLYNNAYNTTEGWIQRSTPINVGTDDKEFMVSRNLAEALALNTAEAYLYAFRDHKLGLEYIRSGKQIADQGFFAELGGYQYHAFLDFREIFDSDGTWAELANRLNGAGVRSVDEAWQEMRMEPVLVPFREVLNADVLRGIAKNDREARTHYEDSLARFLAAAADHVGAEAGSKGVLRDVLKELEAIPLERAIKAAPVSKKLVSDLLSQISERDKRTLLPVAVAWITVHRLGYLGLSDDADSASVVCSVRLREWFLTKTTAEVFQDIGSDRAGARLDAALVAILTAYEDVLRQSPGVGVAEAMRSMFENELVSEYLCVNRFEGVLWFNKEQFERMIDALLLVSVIRLCAEGKISQTVVAQALGTAREIKAAASNAEFRVEGTVQALMAQEASPGPT